MLISSLLYRPEVPTRFCERRDDLQGGRTGRRALGRRAGKGGDLMGEPLPRNSRSERHCRRMALIDDSPRSATVVALTDVTVAFLGQRNAVPLPGQAHANVRADGDARPRQTAAPSEQGGLTKIAPGDLGAPAGWWVAANSDAERRTDETLSLSTRTCGFKLRRCPHRPSAA